jgi:colanic acid/amylovoran biosynthesis glycosyltransferase
MIVDLNCTVKAGAIATTVSLSYFCTRTGMVFLWLVMQQPSLATDNFDCSSISTSKMETMPLQKIAYLAPEIPSISATFVYNEILALQKKGLEIISISIHEVQVQSQNANLEDLTQNTYYLYSQSWRDIFSNNLKVFFRKPKKYLSAFFLLIMDLLSSLAPATERVKLIYHFLQASSVAQILTQTSCQHLHIHFANVPTQIGMYASVLSELPFTFTSHANDLFERGFFLKQKVARSKMAITISEYNREFLINKGALPEKTKVIHCGVDPDQYQYVDRKAMNYPPVIGTLARLVEKKGVDTLILALSQLWERKIDFMLEIGGDGPLKKYLEQLVDSHGLDSKITFLGTMDSEKVFSWMQKLDIFVLACKQDSQGDQDGIPVVLMEAMATGIPVVSTIISGIPELIDDGVSGFLSKPDSPDALAATLEKAIGSYQSIPKVTQTARKRVRKEFDITLNVDRLLEIFKYCQTN